MRRWKLGSRNGSQPSDGCRKLSNVPPDKASVFVADALPRDAEEPKLNTPPYVWADSILLTDATQPPIVIRQKFEDFTGAYVLHCHFLGHEDRGMMLGVQVVCPDNTTKFGTPGATGADDCRPPALIDALPSCDTYTPRHRGAAH